MTALRINPPYMNGAFTENIFRQHETFDLTEADNGVSASMWPPAVVSRDANGLNEAFFGGVVRADGAVSAGMWSYNYDASGNRVASNRIEALSHKDGSMSYAVADPAKFRDTIGMGGTGALYSNTKASLNLAAGIDSMTNGASLTLPAGSYVINGHFGFASTSSTQCTTQIAFGTSGSLWANSKHRVQQANAWWVEMACSYAVKLTAQTTVYVKGSCSVARSGCSSAIEAIRII